MNMKVVFVPVQREKALQLKGDHQAVNRLRKFMINIMKDLFRFQNHLRD